MRNCPLKRVNNSLRKVKYCYGNFLLAETEVVMTTLISFHVKNKNRTKFSPLENSWYFIGIYIIKGIISLA